MVSKLALTFLVISLAYVSEAVFFKQRYPGKKLADLAECKEDSALQGYPSSFKTKNGWGERSAKACSKYCLKQKLAATRKGPKSKKIQNIQGSIYTTIKSTGKGYCACATGGTPTWRAHNGYTSCIFKTPEASAPKPAPKEENEECTEWEEVKVIKTETGFDMHFAGTGVGSKEECKLRCKGLQATKPQVEAVGYVAEGDNAKFCLCYWNVIEVSGEWTVPVQDSHLLYSTLESDCKKSGGKKAPAKEEEEEEEKEEAKEEEEEEEKEEEKGQGESEEEEEETAPATKYFASKNPFKLHSQAKTYCEKNNGKLVEYTTAAQYLDFIDWMKTKSFAKAFYTGMRYSQKRILTSTNQVGFKAWKPTIKQSALNDRTTRRVMHGPESTGGGHWIRGKTNRQAYKAVCMKTN